MSVKFKIGFTMDAETLFGMISKFLPVENLHVEEVVEQSKPDPAIRFDRRFDLPKPRPKQKREPSRPMDLHNGINGVIIKLLMDGKSHHSGEFVPLIGAAGYSKNSVASRLAELCKKDVMVRVSKGTYKLTTEAYVGITGKDNVT